MAMTLEEAQAKAVEWFVKTPLYEQIAGEDIQDCYHAIRALFLRTQPFDAYCVECAERSTFKPDVRGEERRNFASLKQYPEQMVSRFCIDQRLFNVVATCARDANHPMEFIFLHQPQKGVEKIGQYPSLADLSIPETSQFVKVLGKSRLHELNKAIGLAAHGVGVGSYIYLRRIFESLVEDAHKEASKGPAWDEAAYEKERMPGKIKLVRD